MRVSERRIDDAIVRNAEQQLAHADAGQQVVLSAQTIVGRVVQIEDVREMPVAVGNTCEDTTAVVAVLRVDQTMSIVAPDK